MNLDFATGVYGGDSPNSEPQLLPLKPSSERRWTAPDPQGFCTAKENTGKVADQSP